MADFFTHFSCVLDVGTPDNAARALELYQAFMEENAREPCHGDLLLRLANATREARIAWWRAVKAAA